MDQSKATKLVEVKQWTAFERRPQRDTGCMAHSHFWRRIEHDDALPAVCALCTKWIALRNLQKRGMPGSVIRDFSGYNNMNKQSRLGVVGYTSLVESGRLEVFLRRSVSFGYPWINWNIYSTQPSDDEDWEVVSTPVYFVFFKR